MSNEEQTVTAEEMRAMGETVTQVMNLVTARTQGPNEGVTVLALTIKLVIALTAKLQGEQYEETAQYFRGMVDNVLDAPASVVEVPSGALADGLHIVPLRKH